MTSNRCRGDDWYASRGITRRVATIDGDIGYLPLTRGAVATIDASFVSAIEVFQWCLSDTGYALRRERRNEAPTYLHRMVLDLAGIPGDGQADHINRNRLDDRIANLRRVSASENQRNRIASRRSRSGYRGVYWADHVSLWRAVIRLDGGATKHLGYFSSPHDAALVWDRAAIEERTGVVGLLNFGDGNATE